MVTSGSLIFIVCFFQICHGWQDIFNYRPCYDQRMEERMPQSIDNLIALIEKFEMSHIQTTPEHIAEAILMRYRTNGVVYDPNSNVPWSTSQDFEVWKLDLDDRLLKPSIETPIDSFFPREECSLHMSVSHSTDQYPHAGVDVMWEDNNYYYRKKRAMTSSDVKSSNYGYDYDRSDYHENAQHPIEFGVIQTTSGPVSGGLLLAGIMVMYDDTSYSVKELVGNQKAEDMPNEMANKQVDQLLGSTISGKLGQAALLSYNDNNINNFAIGPIGIFGNCTACARIFSLQKPQFSYFSRAEVFGSVDAVIIAKMLNSRGDSRNLKLSQVLRMYYGEHGLFNEDIRACNRHNVYNQMKGNYRDQIQTQALNYMYAYQTYISTINEGVKLHQDDFEEIEMQFSAVLKVVLNEFDRFLSTYSYDDPATERCPTYDTRQFQLETETDLIVVFTPIGTQEDIESQAQYISATARKIGVGYHRSRMAIFNGRTMSWHSPMINYTNIADYSCNYTTFMTYGATSSQDFIDVLDQLSIYYQQFYTFMKRTEEHIGIKNQVVMWNLPTKFSIPSDEFAAVNAWNTFNMSFPDVNFIFVGEEQPDFFNNVFWGGDGSGNTQDDQKIIIVSNEPKDQPVVIAETIVSYIKLVPRMFLYPACDTSNSSLANYQETSHQYINFVTPNFTTLISIQPQNFHFSESVKLMFDNTDTDICVSRIHRMPSIYDPTEETTCLDGNDSPEFEQYYMCDRYVENCSPIFISVSGRSSSNYYCTDEKCKYPNQIQFTMTHEGIVCGCWAILPTPLLIVAIIVLQFYFKY